MRLAITRKRGQPQSLPPFMRGLTAADWVATQAADFRSCRSLHGVHRDRIIEPAAAGFS